MTTFLEDIKHHRRRYGWKIGLIGLLLGISIGIVITTNQQRWRDRKEIETKLSHPTITIHQPSANEIIEAIRKEGYRKGLGDAAADYAIKRNKKKGGGDEKQ
jgi:hypothetical protein